MEEGSNLAGIRLQHSFNPTGVVKVVFYSLAMALRFLVNGGNGSYKVVPFEVMINP